MGRSSEPGPKLITVLLVDDEVLLTELLAQQLEHFGFRVVTFTDPELALSAFAATPSEFDVVLTDSTMPKLSGLELAERLRAIRPAARIVMHCGRLPAAAECVDIVDRLVAKPASIGDIVDAIHAVRRL